MPDDVAELQSIDAWQFFQDVFGQRLQAFVVVDELPRNPTGEVLKRSLIS